MSDDVELVATVNSTNLSGTIGYTQLAGDIGITTISAVLNPNISGIGIYVPYVGCLKNVDLGNYNLTTTGYLSGILADGVTATTQSALDNSTKVATTAYVDSAVDIENLWDRADGVLSPHHEVDSVFVRGSVSGNSFIVGSVVELSHDDGGLKVKSDIGSDASIIIDTYEDKAELKTMATGDDEWVIFSANYDEEWLDILPNAETNNILFCSNCSEGTTPYYNFYGWRTGDTYRRAMTMTLGENISGELRFSGVDGVKFQSNTAGANSYVESYTRGDKTGFVGSTTRTSVELINANFDEGFVEINPTGVYDVFFGEKAAEGNAPSYNFYSWTTDRLKSSFYFDIDKTTKGAVYFSGNNINSFSFDGDINADNFAVVDTGNYWIGNSGHPTPTGSLYNFFALDNSGDALTTGDNNIGIGYYALNHLTTASNNIALGSQSQLWNESGTSNITFGYRTGQYNKYGDDNILIGYNAGKGDSTDTTFIAGNVCIGKESGYDLLNGNEDNMYIGYQAGSSLRGNYNLCYGSRAGYNNSTQGAGSNNIFLGASTATNHLDCDKNIVIGYNIDLPTDDGDNQLNIGNIIFGTGLTGSGTTIAGNIGVGTSTPNSTVQIDGSVSKAYASKSAAYTLTSSDYQIECTANTFTLTLPTASGITGREYSIKNTGTGVITVDANSTETIDGELTQTLNQWDNIKIMSNGTNWIII